MQKLVGITASILILIGGFFKQQHWPGASAILVSGLGLILIFLLLWISDSMKKANGAKEKNAQILLFATLFIGVITAIIKIQHFPFGNVFMFANLALMVLVFIPIYLMYLASEQDENKKHGRFAFLFFYIATTGLFFAVTS